MNAKEFKKMVSRRPCLKIIKDNVTVVYCRVDDYGLVDVNIRHSLDEKTGLELATWLNGVFGEPNPEQIRTNKSTNTIKER